MGILEMEALKKLNIEIIPMYDNYDGSFPNHEANPLKEATLYELKKQDSEQGADLGIAFDGDADRVGYIDETGTIVPMYMATGIIAEDVLRTKKGVVLYDLRSSMKVKEVIELNGGTPSMCRVGHAFIKQQMRDENAIFAGELSGHYYFQENYNTESSALASVMIMNIIDRKNKKLSEIVKEMNVYHHSGEINSRVKDKDEIIKTIEDRYSDGIISHLDGITVNYNDWWFNIRGSNTEPLLRLNLETKDKATLELKKTELLGIIRH